MIKNILKVIFVSCIFTVAAYSQDVWVCIVHPENINKAHIQDRIITVRDSGIIKNIWAKKYITTEWRSYDIRRQQAALVGAIRLAIANTYGGEALSEQILIKYYLTNPTNIDQNISLALLLRRDLFETGLANRSNILFTLSNIAEAQINSSCNQWHYRY